MVTLVPAILVGIRFFQNRTSEIETALVNLSAAADNIAKDLDGKVLGTAQLLYGLARARNLETSDPARCSAFLSEVLEAYSQYTGILTIDPDGNLFCDSLRTGRLLNLKDRNYFKKALLAKNNVITLEPAIGRLTGASVLQIAYPARSESGQLKFVLLASFNLNAFADYHNARLPRGSALMFVDKKGTVLVRPSSGVWFKITEDSIAGTSLFKLATRQIDNVAAELTGADGSSQVWAVASSPAGRDAGLYFMVGQSKDELFAHANARLKEDFAILAAVSLLLFAAVWTVVEMVFRRQIGRLASMATRLGEGDLSVRIAPPYPGGELGSLMTVLNGTAKSLEQQRSSIDELNQKLHQSQKMEALGQLTGGLAHDFNNLLTVVLGNAEHLAEKLSAHPELRNFAMAVVSAAERGAALTKSLLAFSRRQPLAGEDIDVGQQITGMEVMLRQALGSHIQYKFVQGRDVWPATVDPAQFESAILNLVLNARDAMPKGGRLTVEISNAPLSKDYFQRNADVRPGDYVMVSVTDTGVGMTHDVLARAFEPFFTTKSVGKGTGLGLSMAYGFLKQSHGSMRIESQAGQGTTVKLYLPRAQGIQAIQKDDKSAHNSIPVLGGTETILVVEDDDLVRPFVEKELKELGYRVMLANDDSLALEMLRQAGKIDLLFTDIVMPGGVSGPELAKKAAQMRPGIKILYTSGYTEHAEINHVQLDPSIWLLHKPYKRQELAKILRVVLRQS